MRNEKQGILTKMNLSLDLMVKLFKSIEYKFLSSVCIPGSCLTHVLSYSHVIPVEKEKPGV